MTRLTYEFTLASISLGRLDIRTFSFRFRFFVAYVATHANALPNSLKPLDIEIMRRLGRTVNLLPVIAKADTLTQNDLAAFKERVSPTSRPPRAVNDV